MNRYLLTSGRAAVFAAVLVLGACERFGAPVPTRQPSAREAYQPPFAQLDNETERRAAFLRYMTQRVETVNDAIWRQRAFLIELQRSLRQRERPTSVQSQRFARLARRYELPEGMPASPSEESVLMLLRRVDVVPESLILAQAASHTNWGTRREAMATKNYLGVRCDDVGCTLPTGAGDNGRDATRFETVSDGVRRFAHLVNTDSSFEAVRERRALTRAMGAEPTAISLTASFLDQASGATLSDLIRGSRLHRFDVARSGAAGQEKRRG